MKKIEKGNLVLTGVTNRAKYDIFVWRQSLSVPQKLVLVLITACFTGLMAQLSFHLPWTPVPVTGQTLAVLLSAVILGKWWGGTSQAIYAGLGFIGMPWFSNWSSGLGSTWGYIIGFIFASLFLGYFFDKIGTRTFNNIFWLMVFADFLIINGLGLLGLYGWLILVKGSTPTFYSLLLMGIIPFVSGDLVKIIVAAGIGKVVMAGNINS